MKKTNILVTGGSGFLGSHVVDSLASVGFKVHIFDVQESSYQRSSEVDFIKGDILDLEALTKALKDIDVVFHLAAFADLDKAQHNPLDTMKVNVIGTTNVLEAARINKVSRIIFSSSIYVYSRAGGFYRVSKHSCELLLEEYFNRFNLKYTILRFGTLYCPRSDRSNSVYNYLMRANNVVFLVSGRNKSSALWGCFQGPYDPMKKPVQYLFKNYNNKIR